MSGAVKALQEKWGQEKTHLFEKWDMKDCGAYLQYKKQEKDSAMPKDQLGRRKEEVHQMDWLSLLTFFLISE